VSAGSTAPEPLEIRDAVPDDASAIADVYNHYVRESVATFDTEPKSAEDRRLWLRERDASHPVLVALSDGNIVAWGALSPYGHRPAWYPTVELSLYVHPEHLGEGFGRAMMAALLERARREGHHLVVGQIVGGNEPSIALASTLGFEVVGVLREAGEKFGRRLDGVLVQRLLP